MTSGRLIEGLQDKANKLRIHSVRMTSIAGSGHPTTCLSAADIVSALFFHVMRYEVNNPSNPNNDRFVLSKGHACPVLYAALARAGYFPAEELKTLRKLKSRLQGHPSRVDLPYLEASTGSLGQGLSVALGMSLAARLDQAAFRVYCLLGDGESQEGQVWEAAMAASHYRCDNLCAILDYNGYQIDGKIEDVMNLEPLSEKWRSFGWHTIDIDGHNIAEILNAFEQARTYNTYSQAFIRGLVESNSISPTASPLPAPPESSGSTVGADLQVYQRLLEVTP